MNRRTLTFLLLLCACSPAAADDADPKLPPAVYPALRRHGLSVEAFIPDEWRLEISKSGDLNGDGRPDAVLVLRGIDPNHIIGSGQPNKPEFDANPRILAVAFANGKGGYDLALENHTLIPRTTEPSQQDPIDPDGIQAGEIAIKKGTLQVTLGYFGGDMGHMTYTFRYQHKRFELIGYDHINVTRSSGEIREVSINYSTRTVESKTGHISDDADKVTRTKLPKKPLLTLPQIGDGLQFTPLPE